MLAFFAATHTSLVANDRDVAQQIIQELRTHRDAGRLKGFKVDMKVEEGVVLFRGEVDNLAQRAIVVRAAEGINGVTNIVNQITIRNNEPAPEIIEKKSVTVAVPRAETVPVPSIAQAMPQVVAVKQPAAESFSLQAALRSVTPVAFNEAVGSAAPKHQAVRPAVQRSSLTAPSDSQVREAIVSRLSAAKQSGQLAGFGVNVIVEQGVAKVSGRVREEETRSALLSMVSMTPGVRQVIEDISSSEIAPVGHSATTAAGGDLPYSQDSAGIPHPSPVSSIPTPVISGQPRGLQPVSVQNARNNVRTASVSPVRQAPPPNMPGRPVSAGMIDGGGSYGGQQMGTPMPMYPVPQGGCYANGPHYDGPNMPNYAWPGYAAYPNYAAVTYPQQYSPSAWPYIGPFYPYPQVPLGWRKVSLEWDDGWWNLDFTDR